MFIFIIFINNLIFPQSTVREAQDLTLLVTLLRFHSGSLVVTLMKSHGYQSEKDSIIYTNG